MNVTIGKHSNFWFDYYDNDDVGLTFSYRENDSWYGTSEECIILTENDLTEMIDYLTEVRDKIRNKGV